MRNTRNDLIKKIHVAKRQLGLSDDEYRATLADVTGKESCLKLTVKEMADVLNRFLNRGWKARPRHDTTRPDYHHVPGDVRHARIKRYIAGLNHALGYKMTGLDVQARRRFGVDKFIWIDDMTGLQIMAKDLYNRCKKAGINPNADEWIGNGTDGAEG